jgi:hypothetical protein
MFGYILSFIFAILVMYLLWKVIENMFGSQTGKPKVVILTRCRYTDEDFIDMWKQLVEEFSKKGFEFEEKIICCPTGYKGDINAKAPLTENHSIECNGTKYAGDFSEESICKFLDVFETKNFASILIR